MMAVGRRQSPTSLRARSARPASVGRCGLAVLLLVLQCGWAALVMAHDAPDHQLVETSVKIRKQPKDAGLYLHRGRLNLDLEHLRDAEADFRKALQVDPALASAHYFLAETLLKAKQAQAAEAEARAFIASLNPDESGGLLRGYRLLGKSLALQGRARDAAETFRRAIGYSPRPEPEQYAECARAYSQSGTDGVALALTVLDEGMAKLGPLASLQADAIEMDLQAGRLDEALSRLDRQIAAGQGSEFPLFRKGEILAGAKRTAEAQVAFEQAFAAISARPVLRQSTPALVKLRDDIRQRLAQVTRTPE